MKEPLKRITETWAGGFGPVSKLKIKNVTADINILLGMVADLKRENSMLKRDVQQAGYKAKNDRIAMLKNRMKAEDISYENETIFSIINEMAAQKGLNSKDVKSIMADGLRATIDNESLKLFYALTVEKLGLMPVFRKTYRDDITVLPIVEMLEKLALARNAVSGVMPLVMGFGHRLEVQTGQAISSCYIQYIRACSMGEAGTSWQAETKS